jgi:Fe-S cluster biogenesis protein NfuA
MSEAEKTELLSKLDKALDTVRPHLKVDGGDVELVDVSDDLVVSIKWLGNCEFCSMSAMTMRAGIKEAIIQQVPEIKEVIPVNGVAVA